jgi:hypothetical protein
VRAVLSALAPQAGDNAEEPVAPIVNITTGMRELRASLIARTVRQSLRNYGHKSAESTLPECIATDVERALAADEKVWGAALASHPCDSTPVVSHNAPDLEDKGGDALELTAWEREELFHFADGGATYLGYDPAERERWKALAEKLKASNPASPVMEGAK